MHYDAALNREAPVRYFTLIVPLFLIACAQSKALQAAASAPSDKVASLDTTHFQSMLHDRPQYVLLDVRTPEEYSSGHLPGATLIDFRSPDFDSKIAKLDPSKTYCLYCRTGHRSGQACSKLMALNIPCYHLAGGITAWRQAQLPIAQP
jgi:rhodanese-related sulfurtransferase